MINEADLPDRIPVFPLPGALLLPRAKLPLHIFEPRYLAMLDDTLKTSHRLIGMIQPREDESGTFSAIGCAGRVTGFSETEDGRYMITLNGVSRFRMSTQIEGFTPYIRAEVDWSGFARDLGTVEQDPNFRREAFLGLLERFFEARGLSTDWESLKDAEDELMINSLSMLLPFDTGDKQALLEAPSLVDRRETLSALMEFALHTGEDGSEVLQ
ncbi:LON peptidase substrate-binding domain-containing protein [Tropicimonas sp. TH_r6]|uniref:LON peptidase substrate-binding domain-containing protein n=1 Tax=Tropicimonas sp. TH_r6 TaxID=3082085 RepID=UPI00295566F0|nr:LON peptidase substrate-binding domain-containing protein [Tropicimonas sp. TH_r6]MDV7145156.1 LON peptidase substrate-binding domain-containing protein [Tropicimonas sp. TH_r6]